MSNFLSISDDYIDLFPLANLMLVAFPNFLIVGKPKYKNQKLFFEKLSYIKIRSCDIEIWYTFLCKVLLINVPSVSSPRELIISGKDFCYEFEACTDLLNTFHIQIFLNGHTSFEKVEHLDKNEILYLLNGISELNFKILCYQDSIFSCFNYVVNHFLKIGTSSIEEVSKNISMLTPSVLFKLCDIFCKKNKTTENPFTISQILFRHLLNLLITFRIKKSKYIASSLLQSYQNL